MYGKEIGNVSIKINEARDRAQVVKALGESLSDVGKVSHLVQPLDQKLITLNKDDKSEPNIRQDRRHPTKQHRAQNSISTPKTKNIASQGLKIQQQKTAQRLSSCDKTRTQSVFSENGATQRIGSRFPRGILIEKIKNLQRDKNNFQISAFLILSFKNNQEGSFKNKTQPLNQMVLSSSMALQQFQSSNTTKFSRLHKSSQLQYPISQTDADTTVVNAILEKASKDKHQQDLIISTNINASKQGASQLTWQERNVRRAYQQFTDQNGRSAILIQQVQSPNNNSFGDSATFLSRRQPRLKSSQTSQRPNMLQDRQNKLGVDSERGKLSENTCVTVDKLDRKTNSGGNQSLYNTMNSFGNRITSGQSAFAQRRATPNLLSKEQIQQNQIPRMQLGSHQRTKTANMARQKDTRGAFMSNTSFRDYCKQQVVQAHKTPSLPDKKATSAKEIFEFALSQKQILNNSQTHAKALSLKQHSNNLTNRKALFDKARDGQSLRKQIPLNKIKEYLRGTGKLPYNVNFDAGESEAVFESVNGVSQDRHQHRETPKIRHNQNFDSMSEQHQPNQPNIKVEQFITEKNHPQDTGPVFNIPLSDNESGDQDIQVVTNTREAQEAVQAQPCVKKLNMSDSDSDSIGNNVNLPKQSMSPDFIGQTLSPEQLQKWQDLARAPLDECKLLSDKKQKQKEVKKAQKQLIDIMMNDWSSLQTKKGKSQSVGNKQKSTEASKDQSSTGFADKKELILPNLDERIDKFIDALFYVWKDPYHEPANTIVPEVFYQKMVTFGLAPDLKFIQEITNISHFNNRPKTNVRVSKIGAETPTKSARGSKSNLMRSARSGKGDNLPSPNFSNQTKSLIGEENQISSLQQKLPQGINRKGLSLNSADAKRASIHQQNSFKLSKKLSTTEQSQILNENGKESAQLSDKTKVGGQTWQQLKQVAMQPNYQLQPWYRDLSMDDKATLQELIKAQNRQGDNRELRPRRQSTNSQSRSNIHRSTLASPANKTQAKEEEEKCLGVKLQTFKGIYQNGTQLRFVKLLLIFLKKQISKFLEAKVIAKRAAILNSSTVKHKQNQSVSKNQNMMSNQSPKKASRKSPLQQSTDGSPAEKKQVRMKGQQSPSLGFSSWLPKQGNKTVEFPTAELRKKRSSFSPAKRAGTQAQGIFAQGAESFNLPHRFAMSQYMELIKDTWRTIDVEGKQEVSEGKVFKFLRENKILTEKKQMEDMMKQCLFLKKGHEIPKSTENSIIPFNVFQKLFSKPLLLIGMENAIALIEQHMLSQSQEHVVVKPEEDTSEIGQTLTVVEFHRKYMRKVFSSEEQSNFKELKRQQKERKKKRKRNILVEDSPKECIYEQLAQIMNRQNDCSLARELGKKPFGIDKEEAIKIMAEFQEKINNEEGISREKMKKSLERKMMIQQQKIRSQMIKEKAQKRSRGIEVSDTDSDSSEGY